MLILFKALLFLPVGKVSAREAQLLLIQNSSHTLRSDLIGQSVFLRLLEILWSNFDMVRLVYE